MKNCTTHPLPAVGVQPHFLRSRMSIISVAAATALAALGGNAYALGFGRMQVQSALGQPVRAEVELTDAQAANLKAGLAAASVYQEKGLDYNPRVKSIRAALQRRPNGKVVLQLSSDSPMNT